MLDPLIARKTWRTVEPIHAAIYFAPEAGEEYTAVGVADRMAGYFASRSAAMGAVDPEVVIATFFNFDPALVRRSLHDVWTATTPGRLLAARTRAAGRIMARLAPDAIGSDDVVEAATIARRAAEEACTRPEGRPLFAGHAAQPWPEEPHLVLWHAQTLLREFRGDGHIAVLVAEGLSGCEALVTHAATGDISREILQATRQRTDHDWAAAVESLRERGWLDARGAFTESGRAARDRIEQRTDELATAPYEAIGEDGCSDLRRLARPTSVAMAAAFGR